MKRDRLSLAIVFFTLILAGCASSPSERPRQIMPDDSIVVGHIDKGTMFTGAHLARIVFRQTGPEAEQGKGSWDFKTDGKGYFWSIIPPGSYRLDRILYTTWFGIEVAEVDSPKEGRGEIDFELPGGRSVLYVGSYKLIPVVRLNSVHIGRSEKPTEQEVLSWLVRRLKKDGSVSGVAPSVLDAVTEQLEKVGGEVSGQDD